MTPEACNLCPVCSVVAEKQTFFTTASRDLNERLFAPDVARDARIDTSEMLTFLSLMLKNRFSN